MGVRGLIGLLTPALIAWALCGATIGIGRAVTSLQNTLIAHAIVAVTAFGIASFIYQRKFGLTTPLQTAAIYLTVVVVLDLAVVAPFIEKSFAMFASVLGTWIPFVLIFGSTYLAGLYATRSGRPRRRALSKAA